MGKIKVTDREGKLHELEADVGSTIMEIIRDAGLDIEAACGGCCACATCHVLIDRNWTHIIGQPPLNSPETELVEYEKGYDRMQSRLACQIQLEKKHNGLVAHLLDNHKL